MTKLLSIIICSRDKSLYDRLVLNIEKTIGYPHEIICITGASSICEAYQEGLDNSNGQFCVFLHEDIIFHSTNWGDKLISYFREDQALGLVGVAGAKSKTLVPSAWWDCPEGDKVIRIIQHFSTGEIKDQNQGFNKSKIERVAIIDGVFMALRKNKSIHFDKSLDGFHGYDLDLSLSVIKAGYTIYVTDEIVLEHYSSGSLSMSWVNSLFHTHRNHLSVLPISLSFFGYSISQEIRNLIQLFKHYLNLVMKNS